MINPVKSFLTHGPDTGRLDEMIPSATISKLRMRRINTGSNLRTSDRNGNV